VDEQRRAKQNRAWTSVTWRNYYSLGGPKIIVAFIVAKLQVCPVLSWIDHASFSAYFFAPI